jgi:hypothetical protein
MKQNNKIYTINSIVLLIWMERKKKLNKCVCIGKFQHSNLSNRVDRQQWSCEPKKNKKKINDFEMNEKKYLELSGKPDFLVISGMKKGNFLVKFVGLTFLLDF